jgi:hypothetical protein
MLWRRTPSNPAGLSPEASTIAARLFAQIASRYARAFASNASLPLSSPDLSAAASTYRSMSAERRSKIARNSSFLPPKWF